MMTRAPTTDVIPLRSLAALMLSVMALGVLAFSLPPRASDARTVPGLLHRAQTEADERRFLQLLGAVAKKKDVSEFANTDDAPPNKNSVVANTKSEFHAAQVVPLPPVPLAVVPPKSLQLPSVNKPTREPQFSRRNVHAYAEYAKDIWMRRRREWIGLVSNAY
jgi:hypothetical protein